MSFNMGPNRFSPTAWPNFFKAVREENWEQAAKQMENSKWFTQVGNRADRLIERMKNL
jgi:lysozyme